MPMEPDADAAIGMLRQVWAPLLTPEGRLDLVDEQRRHLLVQAAEIADLAAVVRTVLAGEVERTQAHRCDGATSATTWIAAATGCTRSDAQDMVRDGTRLAQAPQVVQDAAVRLGPNRLSSLLTGLHGRTRAAFMAEADTLVRSVASLDADDAATLMRRWRRLVDQDGTDPYVTRRVRCTQVGDVHRLDGVLADEDGLVLSREVDHLAKQLLDDDLSLPADQRRTLDQARADALMELVRNGVAHPSAGRTTAPTLVIACDADDLAAGTGLGTTLGRDTSSSIETVRRLACGADLQRAVLGAASVPLDLGRAVRLATHHQKLAVRLRDACCRFGHCRRPGERSDVHHIDEWDVADGPTDMANLVLLCRYHHRLLHSGDWTMEVRADGVVVATRYDGYTLESRPPPRPGALPLL